MERQLEEQGALLACLHFESVGRGQYGIAVAAGEQLSLYRNVLVDTYLDRGVQAVQHQPAARQKITVVEEIGQKVGATLAESELEGRLFTAMRGLGSSLRRIK